MLRDASFQLVSLPAEKTVPVRLAERDGFNLISAALDYAARGWQVFPCHLDKTPATAHGVKDATSDPALIRNWWEERPYASIGLACGPSGLVVIDIDRDKGGFASWAALKAAHGIDDETLASRTGGGGRHLVYRAPEGFRGKNSAGKLGPGLDVRADGGYIIAPPSPHPSGSAYAWDRSHAEPIPLPVSLAALLESREPPRVAPVSPAATPSGNGYGAAALRGELDILSRAREGARNETLNTAAFKLGQLVAGGALDRSDVARQLCDVARAIGLDEREALATIRSGLDAGARAPRTAPAGPDFARSGQPAYVAGDAPAERLREPAGAAEFDLSECPLLPASARLDPALGLDASPWLDAYIGFSRRWAPRAYDGFHEAVGLWVLSTVAARRVKLDFGGERYPSLYIANVARSSIWTKSTAHHIGADLLKACGLSFLLAPDEATPQALLAKMSIPPTLTDLDTKSTEDRELIRLRLAFAGQKGWDYDEFGQKVSAMMRDSGPMTDFRGILRRFDDAPDRYIYETVGRGECRLVRPYLALLASMPPANMAPYARRGGALWQDGFWARFAFVAPAPEDRPTRGRFPPGERIFPPDLIRSLQAWHDRLGVPLVELVPRKGPDGKPTRDAAVTVTAVSPEVCTLGAGVEDAFYNYKNALDDLAAASNNTDLDGNYSRFPEKALRVAILLASVANHHAIDMRHWGRAQEIAERWRRSLHNLYRAFNSSEDEDGQKEDRVIEIVRRLGTATPADVNREARMISTTKAADLMQRLQQAGALLPAKITHKNTVTYQLAA